MNLWTISTDSKTPRVDSSGLAVLLAFLLGPLGLIYVGFVRLAAALFFGGIAAMLLAFLVASASPALGIVLIVPLAIFLSVAYPVFAWLGYSRYEKGQGPSPAPKGLLQAALAEYQSRFRQINYAVRLETKANHDAIMSLSLDSPYERLRNNEILDTKKVFGAAFGVTDGRYYTTYFFPEKVTGSAVQVSGVCVGAHAYEFSVRDQDGAGWSHRFITGGMNPQQVERLLPKQMRELLLSQWPRTANLWVSEGWLLTETESETVTIEMAMKQWTLLNAVIDLADELGISELTDEVDCSPIEAARKLFPDM